MNFICFDFYGFWELLPEITYCDTVVPKATRRSMSAVLLRNALYAPR